MKLSDFHPDEVKVVGAPAGAMKLSDFHPDEIKVVNAGQSGTSSPAKNAPNPLIKSAIDALPMVGGVAGGILGTPADALVGPMGNVVGAGIGGYLGTAAKNLINKYYDPESAPKTTQEAITQPIVGGAVQGLAQGVGEAVAPFLGQAAEALPKALRQYAAKKAVSATGATGAQSAKFASDAGENLLDQGIVKFGNSQSTIASKATEALENAGNKIGKVISSLNDKGVTVDHSEIVDKLRSRANTLGKDPSQFGVSDSLNRLADRIQTMIDASPNGSSVPIGEAEATKRGFQQAANYNSSPLDLSVSKEAANIYRQAVESAATKADPKAAADFVAEKNQYKLLSPIEEAAAKRARTLNQSPHGGLLDTAATIAGHGVGGLPGAIAAPAARRFLSTRAASSMASIANNAAKMTGSPGVSEAVAPVVSRLSIPAAKAVVSAGSNVIKELPAAAAKNDSIVDTASADDKSPPLRGEDLWASRGIEKLGIKDSALTQKLLASNQGRQLLIQASDLPAGHPGLQKIMDQIKKGFGK